MQKVGPWMIDQEHGGAYRALFGKDGSNLAYRVAFIEKTPRIRIRNLPLPTMCPYKHDDWKNWAEGPFKGDGPDDVESRMWCDEALRLFGYNLEN